MSEREKYRINKAMQNQVEEDLTAYPNWGRELRLLQVELDVVARIKDDINMPLGCSFDGAKVKSGYLHTDALEIEALSFRERACQQKQEEIKRIVQRMEELKPRYYRLDSYVDMLAPKLSQVVRARCFEKKSWLEIEKVMGQTENTLRHYLKEGVAELTQMYEIVEVVRSGG